ncbi:DNA polymerase III subunit [Robertkochia aurantiaca]|uniref:DNA polymerase III subunit n=1 Tax=Robertkochia aurantiaca TaxID=2873700 RepID=UPI001CCD6A14|nr:DNA polymerase III subunit delta' [Robertkochia sp. 3YJGBD-33]
MLFRSIVGQAHLKRHLVRSADNNRIPHAQLFVGPEGSGTLPMAIAYARYILCRNTGGENDTGNESCNAKVEHFNHPDLHFSFPVNGTAEVKSEHAYSQKFMSQWREFLREQPYGNLFDWLQKLGIENKQGLMGVNEAAHLSKALSLKSYEGGRKVLIMWMAEKMNDACSNKLLKLIEEPPKDTVIILIAEDEDQLLQTITSRCQILHFPPLAEADIIKALEQWDLDPNTAQKIAHQAHGNFNKAIDLVNNDSEDLVFERWFVFWVRSAFKAKGNKKAINDLLSWSEEIARTGRETQKQFLQYCIEVFRQALMVNYQAQELAYTEFSQEDFRLEKFAPFVHGNNILEINRELEEAIYHIERNGNGKVILGDLAIKLTRLLHARKE